MFFIWALIFSCSYSQEEKHAFAEHINNCLKEDQHVGHRLPINLESEQLFSECEDGLLLCKLINCAEYDTIDVRALNVPTKRKPLLVFHKVCDLPCCPSRNWNIVAG